MNYEYAFALFIITVTSCVIYVSADEISELRRQLNQLRKFEKLLSEYRFTGSIIDDLKDLPDTIVNKNRFIRILKKALTLEIDSIKTKTIAINPVEKHQTIRRLFKDLIAIVQKWHIDDDNLQTIASANRDFKAKIDNSNVFKSKIKTALLQQITKDVFELTEQLQMQIDRIKLIKLRQLKKILNDYKLTDLIIADLDDLPETMAEDNKEELVLILKKALKKEIDNNIKMTINNNEKQSLDLFENIDETFNNWDIGEECLQEILSTNSAFKMWKIHPNIFKRKLKNVLLDDISKIESILSKNLHMKWKKNSNCGLASILNSTPENCKRILPNSPQKASNQFLSRFRTSKLPTIDKWSYSALSQLFFYLCYFIDKESSQSQDDRPERFFR